MPRVVMELDENGNVVGVAGSARARSLRSQIEAVAHVLKREK